MTAHLPEQRLNDYADDLLPHAERTEADSHLESCAACAGRLDRLRALRSALAALPRTLDPGVDLRPAIRAEVVRRAASRSRSRALRELRAPLAAAAAVLVLATASITALAVRSTGDRDRALTGEAAGVERVASSLLALDREYVRAADELRRALEAESERLAPETVRLVRANIEAVDRALAESRAALLKDPASPVLRELVLAAHRQRLDMLRRATALAAES